MTELLKLEDFPQQDYDKLRYDDMDTLNHVSNVQFATFFSTGRSGIILRLVTDVARKERVAYVVGRLEIDYKAEIFWPGTVEVGTAVKSIGRTSAVLTQALYQKQKCVATAVTVMVQVDQATHKPAPISDASRALLESLMFKPAVSA
jgi:acyl-CoA thioester hydrolase